jgi:hypothetical protein
MVFKPSFTHWPHRKPQAPVWLFQYIRDQRNTDPPRSLPAAEQSEDCSTYCSTPCTAQNMGIHRGHSGSSQSVHQLTVAAAHESVPAISVDPLSPASCRTRFSCLYTAQNARLVILMLTRVSGSGEVGTRSTEGPSQAEERSLAAWVSCDSSTHLNCKL